MKEYKITVIGDIMGEPSVYEQAKRPGGKYDFYPALKALKSYFDEADYGIGNLETVLGGEELGYTSALVSFNTPDEIADAVKAIGIDAVTTANNHAMDRGPEAIKRTCRVLDEKGLAHTGTYPEATDERTLYFTVGDTKVALLSYTNGVNYDLNGKYDFTHAYEMINFLRPYTGAGPTRLPEDPSLKSTQQYIEELLGRPLIWEEVVKLRKAMHLPVAYGDNVMNTAPLTPLLDAIEKEYKKARANADVVIIMPHSGGQFNTEPGLLSTYIFKAFAKMGFDVILGAHSHTTQRAEMMGSTVTFNSLGNVTMSPLTSYSVKEALPEYGIAAHIYVAEKKITRITFSLFKMVEHVGDPLHTVPVDEFYASLPEGLEKAETYIETSKVYTRITGKEFPGIQREYPLYTF